MKKGSAKAERDRAEKSRTEERVDRIMEMMTGGRWVAGTSHRQLGKEWELTVTTVERLAAEASRVLRRVTRGDDEEVRTRILAGIEAIRVRCELKTRRKSRKKADGSWQDVEVPDPDYHTALRAYELQGKFLGLLTHNIHVSTDAAPDRFEGWTDAELLAFSETGEVPARLRPNGKPS